MATYVNTIRYGLSLDTSVLDDSYCDKCWISDYSGGPSYVDETTDANDTGTADVPLAGYEQVDDCIYVGDAAKFNSLGITLSTAAVGGTRVWEYWDGDSWEACETQTVLAGNINLTAQSVKVFWFPSANWTTCDVNGTTKYYVRLRVTSAYSTAGTISYIALGRYHTEWSKTIYIPETTSRTFKAAFIQARTQTHLDLYLNVCLFVQVGSGTRTSTALYSAISADNPHFLDHCGDFTSTFTSDFGSGASQTVKVMFSTLGVQPYNYKCGANASGDIVITYEAEEQQTRIKTVCIPIESKVTNTSTSLEEIGTNQWPDLSTFCPESSKTFRDVFLTLRHDWVSRSAAYLSYAIDSESATDLGQPTGYSYDGDVPIHLTWVRNDISTSSAHAIKVKHTGAGSYGLNVGGVLWVTYEYDHTSSTSILNSIIMSVPQSQYSANDTSRKIEARLRFLVNEPGTVTLVQSGLIWGIFHNYQPAWYVGAGSQSYRLYKSGAYYAPTVMHHRIDSGGAQGAGITLTRGMNTITTSIYPSNSYSDNYSTSAFCLAVLNYTSGKNTGGAHKHNKTIWWKLTTTTDETSVYANYTSVALPLGSNYFLSSACLYWNQKMFEPGWFRGLRGAGEGNAIDGPFVTSAGVGSIQMHHLDWVNWIDLDHFFKHWPTDPVWGRLDGSASHTYELVAQAKVRFFNAMLVTFHGITSTVSGTVSGYSGDGSGLTVDIFRKDGDEYIGSATTSTGGTYSFTWYSNNEDLYAVCRQSSSLCGRSDDGKAS